LWESVVPRLTGPNVPSRRLVVSWWITAPGELVYKSFFGLKKNPFNVNPDPAYLYLTPQMRQSLEELTYGIEARKGLMLLTGEAGTGKTTFINHLLLWLGHQRAHTAFIFNSHLDSEQLFDFILSDFEIPLTAHAKTNPLLVFNDWLLARYRNHDLVVLIVDEAQGLPVQVLEEIRLLLNMETPNEKLLQILLVGQPELETKLKRPELRQLQQRISLRCKTAPLTLSETHGYIEDRLHTAGAANNSLFTPEAMDAIHSYSRGIPRVINLLCENALINAYVEQQRPIPSSMVEDAALELQFDDYRPVAPRLRTVQPTTSAADLHSILAKIQADACYPLQDTNRASLHLVDTQKPIPYQPDAFEVRHAQSTDGRTAFLPRQDCSHVAHLSVADADRDIHTYRVIRNSAAQFLFTKLEAARNLGSRLHFRSKMMELIGILRAMQLPERTASVTNRIRIAAEPAFVRFSEAFGPEVKARAGAAKILAGKSTAYLRGWCAQNFNEEMYGKSLAASAALGALLYLFARRMAPAQAWQHPGYLILSFAGFLLCALSLALGTAILMRARRQLLADTSELLSTAVRWLRAPIYPMQIRGLSTLGGKVHTQRRA
jgi:general secretion pathway protein A